jgi:hypothetical protein
VPGAATHARLRCSAMVKSQPRSLCNPGPHVVLPGEHLDSSCLSAALREPHRREAGAAPGCFPQGWRLELPSSVGVVVRDFSSGCGLNDARHSQPQGPCPWRRGDWRTWASQKSQPLMYLQPHQPHPYLLKGDRGVPPRATVRKQHERVG